MKWIFEERTSKIFSEISTVLFMFMFVKISVSCLSISLTQMIVSLAAPKSTHVIHLYLKKGRSWNATLKYAVVNKFYFLTNLSNIKSLFKLEFIQWRVLTENYYWSDFIEEFGNVFSQNVELNICLWNNSEGLCGNLI